MKTRTLWILLVLTALVAAGCKSGDSASTDTTTTSKTDTTATDTTKPADSTTDAAKTDDSKSADNSVVGTWTMDDENTPGATAEFKEDGTEDISGVAATGPKGATIDSTTKYKVEGDKLTLTPTSMKATAPDGATDDVKKIVDQINSTATPENLSKLTYTVDLKWTDKDHFTLTNEQTKKVVTYTRKS
jgi:hypothetical protein